MVIDMENYDKRLFYYVEDNKQMTDWWKGYWLWIQITRVLCF